MPIDGGKHMSLGGNHVLILSGFSYAHDQLAFYRYELERMRAGRQLAWIDIRDTQRDIRFRAFDLCPREHDRAVAHIGEAGDEDTVSNAMRLFTQRVHPERVGPVLQNHRGAGLIVSDISFYSDSFCLIFDPRVLKYLVEPSQRHLIRMALRRLHDAQIRKRGYLQQNAGHL